MHRRLTLKAEPLTELTTGELTSVGAGALPTTQCFTGYYPSINAPCETLTGTVIRQTALC